MKLLQSVVQQPTGTEEVCELKNITTGRQGNSLDLSPGRQQGSSVDLKVPKIETSGEMSGGGTGILNLLSTPNTVLAMTSPSSSTHQLQVIRGRNSYTGSCNSTIGGRRESATSSCYQHSQSVAESPSPGPTSGL